MKQSDPDTVWELAVCSPVAREPERKREHLLANGGSRTESSPGMELGLRGRVSVSLDQTWGLGARAHGGLVRSWKEAHTTT